MHALMLAFVLMTASAFSSHAQNLRNAETGSVKSFAADSNADSDVKTLPLAKGDLSRSWARSWLAVTGLYAVPPRAECSPIDGVTSCTISVSGLNVAFLGKSPQDMSDVELIDIDVSSDDKIPDALNTVLAAIALIDPDMAVDPRMTREVRSALATNSISTVNLRGANVFFARSEPEGTYVSIYPFRFSRDGAPNRP